jgi:hypothetical protein
MLKELTGRAPVSTSITRRRMVAGAAALGAVSLAGIRSAQAQDTTTPATPGADTTESTDQVSQAAESYQNFVLKLATNLGVADAASVDTGIRDALKTMVDERLAAGEISANFATERKTEIDASEAPLWVGFGERGGHGFGDNRDNDPKPGNAPGSDDDTDVTGTPEATGAILIS